MKTTNMLIILVFAVLVAVAAFILLQQAPAQTGGQTGTGGGTATTEPLSEVDKLHLAMDSSSISGLKGIISGNYDDYTREQAVIALADVSLRTGNEDETISYLKGIATSDSSEEVRTAASSSIWAMRETYPANISGSIDVSLPDEPIVGKNVTFTISVYSEQESGDVQVGLMHWVKDPDGNPIEGGATLISHLPTNMDLEAGQMKEVPVTIQLDEPGEYEVVFYLKIGLDTFDSKTYEDGGIVQVGTTSGSFEPA